MLFDGPIHLGVYRCVFVCFNFHSAEDEAAFLSRSFLLIPFCHFNALAINEAMAKRYEQYATLRMNVIVIVVRVVDGSSSLRFEDER